MRVQLIELRALNTHAGQLNISITPGWPSHKSSAAPRHGRQSYSKQSLNAVLPACKYSRRSEVSTLEALIRSAQGRHIYRDKKCVYGTSVSKLTLAILLPAVVRRGRITSVAGPLGFDGEDELTCVFSACISISWTRKCAFYLWM